MTSNNGKKKKKYKPDAATRAANRNVIRDLDEQQFGNGQVGGGRTWEAPVHGTTADGDAITASFGKGGREGQTLASRGHTGMAEFYNEQADGKTGHDHYGPDGNTGTRGDRGRW